MTPTTASPSSVLLNPVVQSSAKSAAGSNADTASSAALSGFGLLLGAVQQLQQKLPTPTGDGATETIKVDAGTRDGSGDDGKALPQLGTILPSLAQPVPQTSAEKGATVNSTDGADTNVAATEATTAAATETNATAANSKDAMAGTNAKAAKSKDKESSDGKEKKAAATAVDPALTLATLPPGAPGVVIQPVGSSGAAVSLAAASTGTDAVDVSAQLGVVGDGKAGRPVIGSNATVPDDVGTGDPAAVNNTGSTAAAADVKDAKGSGKSPTESDFDALVKHFDVSTSTQPPAANNVSDGGAAQQASRTYFAAANSSASVSVPVGSSGWSDAVADKVMWFSAHQISSAEIHLNPPDLGPLQVRVSMQHDQASVIFTSQHAAVRDALDQALPRLRDMMGSQGMHLLDVSVGGQGAQQSPQQFGRNQTDRGASFGGFFNDSPVAATVTGVTAVDTARLSRSGVDAYA